MILVDASNVAVVEPAVAYLSPSELDSSVSAILAGWDGREPVWVFGYGSLIWHPEISYDQKVAATVYGFHRSLCLWSREYRGTPERPGLVLGLEPGGSCRGVAFRIAPDAVLAQLKILWEREMRTGSYIARWLDLRSRGAGVPERIRAIGFVMNRRAQNYAGEIDRNHLVETLCTARGKRGTCADYLLSTVRTLSDYGIHDRRLAELAEEVRLSLPSNSPPNL